MFDATKRQLLLTANAQQLSAWPYKFGSSRHIYSPETMRAVSRAPQSQLSHETSLTTNGEKVQKPATREPERRYRYELGQLVPFSAIRPLQSLRLDNIQVKLADLRRQLDAELAVDEVRRQVALGSPCLRTSDCSNSIKGSQCKLDTFTCSCLPYHVEYNSTTCLPRKCQPAPMNAAAAAAFLQPS